MELIKVLRGTHRGLALLLATWSLVPTLAQTPDGYHDAKVVSVREVRHASFPSSRYPTTPYYTIDLAVLLSGQTYCAGYETPVLDEVHDLLAAKGQEVKMDLHEKNILLILPAGRRLKADLVKPSQC